MSADAIVLLLLMRALVPGAPDAPALASAIVASGATWDEATWLVGIAYRESGFRLNAVGDQGRAKCAMQVHHAPREALTDANVCVRAGLYILRASMRLCPSQPLAAYAGARCGSDVAGRITRDRDRVRKVALRRVLGVLP